MSYILSLIIAFVLGGLMWGWVLTQLEKFFKKND